MKIKRPEPSQRIPEHAKRVFTGDIFDVWQWDQVLYDGSSKIFEKLKRDDTVTVAASTSDKKLLLVEDEQPGHTPILTFPGGRMDDNESDPLDAAKRELLEETGYASQEWELWKAYQPVNKIDWALYIFIAKNCKKVQDAEPDAGERISLSIVTLDELIGYVKDPRFMSEDIKVELTEAKYDPEARKRLEQLLF